MKTMLLAVLAVVVLLSLVGCGDGVGIGTALSAKERVTSPDVAASDLTIYSR